MDPLFKIEDVSSVTQHISQLFQTARERKLSLDWAHAIRGQLFLYQAWICLATATTPLFIASWRTYPLSFNQYKWNFLAGIAHLDTAKWWLKTNVLNLCRKPRSFCWICGEMVVQIYSIFVPRSYFVAEMLLESVICQEYWSFARKSTHSAV